MNDQKPFSLKIFVATGDPDGLRLVERSNWIGKGVMFPRAAYPEARRREEFAQTGIYLLLGPRDEGDGEMLYIGEGDPVRPRLEEHYAKKDFWTRAVFFVAGSGLLNKAHVQYLEAKLVELAKQAKRMPLNNGNTPSVSTLSEADRADMDVFLENILGILPVLGVHAFEVITTRTSAETGAVGAVGASGSPLLICENKGVLAKGLDTPQGFVVKAGSTALAQEVPSFCKHFPTQSELRARLKETGVMVGDGDYLRFTQDYSFNSPSMASSMVLGSSSNGRTDWKDEQGRTLKELQEAQVEA